MAACVADGGSIPACAGEPNRGRSPARRCEVYPRVCGGTVSTWRQSSGGGRLSPRVRGNRAGAGREQPDERSIPACAGEPGFDDALPLATRVYPRVCGGTCRECHRRRIEEGLSPRVRGNRQGTRGLSREEGSIPACAGEPEMDGFGGAALGVYPRVCGGTVRRPARVAADGGLSPRVRGNQLVGGESGAGIGSIPACAGEPHMLRHRASVATVYPRVCGGTTAAVHNPSSAAGLSPRVRGNPISACHPVAISGSIPACAGEPHIHRRQPCQAAVYPRVCGGTTDGGRSGGAGVGLSPRVRGNRPTLSGRPAAAGSIPACAGEPRRTGGIMWAG